MSDAIECEMDVLLVEDNPDDARIVERLVLESPDDRGGRRPVSVPSVRSVERLADGLEVVRSDPPDVVLLDLQLPDSRGLETVDRMVRHAPRTPVVVLTGRSGSSVGAEAIRRGAQDYLVKGQLSTQVLLRTLRYAIERERNHRQLLDQSHRLALLTKIVTQDVRNDVSMIVGRGDQLRDAVGPDHEPILEGLLEAAEHVVDLIDTAGEVVDVLSGDGIQRRPCDLRLPLEEAVTRVERTHDAEVRLEWDDDASSAVTVHGSTLLSGVFEHLLAHTVERTDGEPPSVSVQVDVGEDRARVRIPWADAAVPETRPDPRRVAGSDALATVDRSFATRSGQGVYLYLVTVVLDEIGGTLDVAEGTPHGTTVTVELGRVGDP